MKKQIALFLAGFMALQPLPAVFAAEAADGQAEHVATEFNNLIVGQKGQPLNDIYLTESAPGLFQKGKAIYLEIDGDVYFEDGATVEVIRGDLKIESITVDGNRMKLMVEKASGQRAAILRITNLKATVPGDTPFGTYSLNLVTKNTGDYGDNTLGDTGFDTAYIPLLREFAFVADKETHRGPEYGVGTTLTAGLEEDFLYAADLYEIRQVPLGARMYFAEDGSLMLPLRAFILGCNPYSTIEYDGQTREINIGLGSRLIRLTVDKTLARVNGDGVMLEHPVTVSPEGYAFVSLADFSKLAFPGLYDKETQTLTIKA